MEVPFGVYWESDPDLQNIVEWCLRVEHIHALQADFEILAFTHQCVPVRAREVSECIPPELDHLKSGTHGDLRVGHRLDDHVTDDMAGAPLRRLGPGIGMGYPAHPDFH